MAEFDLIVAGANSSGSALSYRLFHYQPNHKMLLLEAGGRDLSSIVHVPAAIAAREKAVDLIVGRRA